MTSIELVDSLVEFIKEVVKEYNLTTKVKGQSKVPSVYAGYLPSEEEEEDDSLNPNDYPFIIVRFIADTDDIGSSDSTSIRLIIGTYSEDEQNGWRDTLNIATRIKIELKKQQTIGPFALTGKIQTDLFEEQLKPYWHVIMDLDYFVPQVQAEWSD